MVVYERPAMPELGRLGLGVSVLWWHKDTFPKGIAPDENTSLQSAIARIKKAMLDHGAVAEAVELIGAIEPFEDKELNIMAEKLSKKPAAKAPAKSDKKAAPAKKPAGNTEALAKAREAKQAEAAKDRKYKVSVKLKDVSVREGTWTARMVQIILGNTTTDAAKAELAKDKEFSDKKLDFSWAEKKGYITF